MSDKPRTDAFREVVIGQYKEDELTGNGMGNILSALTDIETLERERDEARADLEFRRGLFQLQEKQLNEVRAERDKWKVKFIQQNKDLGCEMMDPGGTIWDYAKKLQDKNKDIQCKLVAERSLSNQLAGALMVTRWDSYNICKEAIFAWKESRDF